MDGLRYSIPATVRAGSYHPDQLAGINFPSDAVGTTSALSGTLVLGPDGSVNATRPKIAVDLRDDRND